MCVCVFFLDKLCNLCLGWARTSLLYTFCNVNVNLEFIDKELHLGIPFTVGLSYCLKLPLLFELDTMLMMPQNSIFSLDVLVTTHSLCSLPLSALSQQLQF